MDCEGNIQVHPGEWTVKGSWSSALYPFTKAGKFLEGFPFHQQKLDFLNRMKTQCFSLGSELHKDELVLKNYLVTCNDSFELSIKGSSSLWHPTPALLPGKSHGQRSLVGRSPWGR